MLEIYVSQPVLWTERLTNSNLTLNSKAPYQKKAWYLYHSHIWCCCVMTNVNLSDTTDSRPCSSNHISYITIFVLLTSLHFLYYRITAVSVIKYNFTEGSSGQSISNGSRTVGLIHIFLPNGKTTVSIFFIFSVGDVFIVIWPWRQHALKWLVFSKP